MKNSLRPLFLLHQTLQLALCIWAGSVLLASAKPTFIRQTARWWSVIPHSRELVCTAPESKGGEIYTTPANAWLSTWWSSPCVWLPAMETHFMKLSMNSACADIASRVSFVLGSECCNWRQTIFPRYVLKHPAVPYCELVWPTTSLLSCCCFDTFSLHNNSTYNWLGQL